MSLDDFRAYYENRHALLAMKYDGGATTRYVRRYLD
ncbi:MAG: EthD domain-containing protein, partial [Novosphingobium sp.]